MKLFKQLLIAPAALGMIAPTAINANELNIETVSDYATPTYVTHNEPVKGIGSSAFSDVHPTDWSFQALKSTHKRHGCKAVMPNGTMTRFEAAKILNACLASVPNLNDQEQKLVEEFGYELAQIRGADIDGSEGADDGLYAGAFSPTTRVSGEANFLVGAQDIDQSSDCGNCSHGEALHAVYNLSIDINTSFSGEDALLAKFETGNAANTRFLTDTYNSGYNDEFKLSTLYYTRPVGDFLLAAGPKFEMDALVATTTSSYSNEGLFHGWWYSPNGYSNHPKEGEAGAALAYINDNGFNAGVTYIGAGGADSNKGLLTEEGFDVATLSVGYDGENFGGGLIYTMYDDPSALLGNVYDANGAAITGDVLGEPVFIGLGAYWQITESLDVSLGIDWLDLDYRNFDTATVVSVGVDYEFGPGTLSGGMANIPGYNYTSGAQDDAGTAYELYYKFPVSDQISVTPMLMVMDLDSSGATDWLSETIFAVETTLKF